MAEPETPERSPVETFRAPPAYRKQLTDFIHHIGGAAWSRPGLEPAQRSMITLSVLTTLCRPDELRIHVGMALDNGLTREQICETLMHCGVYAGLPGTVRAMEVAAEVFEERDGGASA